MYICYIFKIIIYLPLFSKFDPSDAAKNKPSIKQVNLDIKSTKGNNDFEYKKTNDMVTFTCKPERIFNKIKEGRTEIWKTDNPENFSNLVKVTLVNNENKKITIQMEQNKTKVFEKEQNGKWTEKQEKESDPTNNEQESSSSKTITKDTSDKQKISSEIIIESEDSDSETIIEKATTPPDTKPNEPAKVTAPESSSASPEESSDKKKFVDTRTKLKVSEHPQEIKIIINGASNDTSKYKVKKDFNDHDYIIKKGNHCSEVKFEDTTVWKTGDDDIEEAISISYSREDLKIVVRSKKKLVSYCKNDDGDWKKTFIMDFTEELESEQSSSEDEEEVQITPPTKQPQTQTKPEVIQPTTTPLPIRTTTYQKSAIHEALCTLLKAEDILSDLSNGINIGLKYVFLPIWLQNYVILDITIPLLSRELCAFIFTNNVWSFKYINNNKSINQNQIRVNEISLDD